MKMPWKEMLFVILLIGMPLGAYFWVFRPANEKLEAQRADIATKTRKLEDLRRALNRIDDLNKEVAQLREAVRFFEDKLPQEHEIHKVLAQISTIAKSQHLETRLFETEDPKPFARYSELPIKVEMYGDFDDYYQFLLDLEQMPRITRIKEMQLKSKPADGVVAAEFVLSVFFEPAGHSG